MSSEWDFRLHKDDVTYVPLMSTVLDPLKAGVEFWLYRGMEDALKLQIFNDGVVVAIAYLMSPAATVYTFRPKSDGEWHRHDILYHGTTWILEYRKIDS